MTLLTERKKDKALKPVVSNLCDLFYSPKLKKKIVSGKYVSLINRKKN